MLLGCTNWKIILGWFDVYFSMSTMGMYNSETRRGYFGVMLIIFSYLKQNIRLHIIYNTSFIEDQGGVGININWSYLYLDDVEDHPHDRPYTKFKPVMINAHVYLDCVHDI